ncbi:PREDICTED: interferon omega-1-like [Propithecus coquereli]|uniref:interferon omega-1-like n=1 Tax=Propithecus coquereli TaxID=379532 RepID=UPI00063FCF46|nr:PREDICTED: interferon omega-1-like [Propithecus coquereli]
MALLLSLLMALVMCSCGPLGSLGCDLPKNHGLLSRKTLVVLRQMRISTSLCLEDRNDFRFPQQMVNDSQLQKAQAVSVLHEMLQQIFNLFHTERSSAAWNPTLLVKLRAGLHLQLEHLETCLQQVMVEEDSASVIEDPTLALRRYFWRIHLYLQEKNYSDCAWEIVRLEVMSSFSSSTNLQEKFGSKDGDLGSS